MNQWNELIIGTLQVAPELQVLVNLIGAMFLLEIATNIVALLSGMKR